MAKKNSEITEIKQSIEKLESKLIDLEKIKRDDSEIPKTNHNPWDKRAFVVSLLALLLSISFSFLSESRSHRTEEISIAAATQAQMALIPEINPFIYIGDSTDLLSDTDIQRLSRAGMNARVLDTTIIYKMAPQENDESSSKYLFVALENTGQGSGKNVIVNSLQWVAKDQNIEPLSLTNLKLGTIRPGNMVAIMIDSSDIFLAPDPISYSNLRAICLYFTYEDIIGNTYSADTIRCSGDPPPDIVSQFSYIAINFNFPIISLTPSPIDFPPAYFDPPEFEFPDPPLPPPPDP